MLDFCFFKWKAASKQFNCQSSWTDSATLHVKIMENIQEKPRGELFYFLLPPRAVDEICCPSSRTARFASAGGSTDDCVLPLGHLKQCTVDLLPSGNKSADIFSTREIKALVWSLKVLSSEKKCQLKRKPEYFQSIHHSKDQSGI